MLKRMNSELRKELLAKMGVSRQRLNQRADLLKEYVPMTSEEAAYCLAYEEGLSLEKYLPRPTVMRVRELLSALHFGQPVRTKRRQKQVRGKERARELILAGGIRLPDPILPQGILDDAARMATTAYPMLYVFENSVRHAIAMMLGNKFGVDWWNRGAIPEDVKSTVAGRDGKSPQAWHSARVTHPIFFTEAKDLIAIVEKNWKVFSALFPRKDWFADLVSSIDMARDAVSHMNPLQRRDVDTLRENLSEWWEVIRERSEVLKGGHLAAYGEVEKGGGGE